LRKATGILLEKRCSGAYSWPSQATGVAYFYDFLMI
jgi:hypothetical protein